MSEASAILQVQTMSPSAYMAQAGYENIPYNTFNENFRNSIDRMIEYDKSYPNYGFLSKSARKSSLQSQDQDNVFLHIKTQLHANLEPSPKENNSKLYEAVNMYRQHVEESNMKGLIIAFASKTGRFIEQAIQGR